MTHELNRIVSETQRLERPKLVETAQVVVDIMRDAIGKDQTPGVALIEDHPPKSTWQFIQPPFRLLQWLDFAGFERPL